MSLQETKSQPETTVFLLSDMTDVQIAVSRISNPSFIQEACPIDRSLLATMASELATNIIKYAGRGLIRITSTKRDHVVDIEIWAEDQGPGIADISLAMNDHFTTGNTLGLGLPGVRRMADEFAVQSELGSGTVIYARKRIDDNKSGATKLRTIRTDSEPATQQNPPLFDVGYHNRPTLGETVSGDLADVVEFDGYVLLIIADVSGHGLKAHELSTRISTYILDNICKDLTILITGLHRLLIGTLGAALGLLLIDIEAQTFQYLGVGNTGASRSMGEAWKGISRDGILGQRLPGLYSQTGVITKGDIFAMWTDGISDHAGQKFAHTDAHASAEKIAHDAVYELGKLHDDASCLIFKWLA